MNKITQILEHAVRGKYFEAGVHIKNPIKNSYQDGLGRTTQTLNHVVVVLIFISDKRKSQINEYSDMNSKAIDMRYVCYLYLVADVDDQSIWDRWNRNPHLVLQNFKAGDTILLHYGDHTAVRMRAETHHEVGLWARRVVIHPCSDAARLGVLHSLENVIFRKIRVTREHREDGM